MIQGFPTSKFIHGDNTYIKVIDFPASKKVTRLGESMWVKITQGDENDGYGTIENVPMCSSLCVGDRIQYGRGNHINKPQFIKHCGQMKVRTFEAVPGLPSLKGRGGRALDHKVPEFIFQALQAAQ